MNGWSLVIAS